MLKLNPDYMYFGYDLNLDGNGLRLDKYDVSLVLDKDDVRKCNFNFIDSEYPTDLVGTISTLRGVNDAHGLNEFVGSKGFDVNTNNFLTILNLKRLSFKHKLLEKVYDDKAVEDGMNVVVAYIHYVNMETGVEYAECLKVSPYTESTVQNLVEAGFVAIENSHLMSNIDKLSRVKGNKVLVETDNQPQRKS